jgi:hypothetical protein
MTNLFEFRSRAALCRRLAEREPTSKVIWLAEAERWSRLAGDRIASYCPEHEALDFALVADLDSCARD